MRNRVSQYFKLSFYGWRKLGEALLIALILSLALASIASAMLLNYKLSGAMQANGDIQPSNDCPWVYAGGFQVSPDNSRVVFIADKEWDGLCELYSVAIPNGTPVKLNSALAGAAVTNFWISPDSSRVVFRADQYAYEAYELYSVPIGGGTAVKLNDALDSDRDVDNDFRISPDSSRVIYLADKEVYDRNELYSVAITGGTPVKLNASTYALDDFEITADSARVVYRGSDNLYSVPIGGGTSVVLYDSVASGGLANGFLVSPDGSRAVFTADPAPLDVYELFSVPVTGGTPVPLVPNTPVGNYKISPDSTKVVYIASPHIYSVPIAGGSPQVLSGPFVTGGNADWQFFISPDSSRVVYTADQETDGVTELYSVPIGGGTPVKLNGPLVSGGDVVDQTPWISPNSQRVIYLADQDVDEVHELYSAPVGGGTAVKLNGPLAGPGGLLDVTRYDFSLDSAWVFYRADQDVDEMYELYRVPAGGGTSVKINWTLVSGGDAGGFHLDPNNDWVIYRADQEADDKFELFISYNAPFNTFLPMARR